MARLVVDKCPEWHGNGCHDGGNPGHVLSLMDKIEPAREGRHHDDERENLTKYCNEPNSAIVLPTIFAVLFGHCDNAFGKARKNVIELR